MKLMSPPSYDAYRLAQRQKFRKKRNRVWVRDCEWDFLADSIRQHASEVRKGLCHGVRKGMECNKLSELLEIPVIGTEIAKIRQDRVVGNWDFHQTKPEWDGQFSFVYSNSLDHSYDPHLALAMWTTQLHFGGIIVLHWGEDDAEPSSPADCFGASCDEYAGLLGIYCSRIRTIPTPKQNRALVIGTCDFRL